MKKIIGIFLFSLIAFGFVFAGGGENIEKEIILKLFSKSSENISTKILKKDNLYTIVTKAGFSRIEIRTTLAKKTTSMIIVELENKIY